MHMQCFPSRKVRLSLLLGGSVHALLLRAPPFHGWFPSRSFLPPPLPAMDPELLRVCLSTFLLLPVSTDGRTRVSVCVNFPSTPSVVVFVVRRFVDLDPTFSYTTSPNVRYAWRNGRSQIRIFLCGIGWRGSSGSSTRPTDPNETRSEGVSSLPGG